MTTPSPSDGTEPAQPSVPSPAADEEPLPPTGDVLGSDESLLVNLTGDRPAPDGAALPKDNSFAAGFARQNFFAGARLLKPGRRVAVALAGVTGLAVIGVGVAAGVSRFGGDDTVQSATKVQSAAEAQSTDAASTAPTSSASSGAVKAPHRPSGSPKAGSAQTSTGPVVTLPGQPAQTVTVTPGGNAPQSGATKSSHETVTQPPKATTQPIVFTGGLIQNFASDRCLATQGGSRAAGTPMVLADCSRNDPSQGWTFPSDGTVRDFGGTMCLDVSSPGNGALVRIAQCSSSRSANQRFVLKSSYDLVDVVPDLCVDAKDKNTAAGTLLQLWSCVGTSNQKWRSA